MASPSLRATRTVSAISIAFVWSVWMLLGNAQGHSSESATKPVPVLVELFTSEGCSDCPPADALLAELDAKQFVPGAEAIVLSEHVTYWDHLGWRDPFSLNEATQRQEEYVRRFGLDSAYTPQMVVDGTSQFVGSNRASLQAALSRAAARPKLKLTIRGARWDRGNVRFEVEGEKAIGSKLIAVLAADATHSEVKRGENAGRTMHHTAVARALKVFSSEAVDGRLLTLQSVGEHQEGSTNGKMRLVVFAVESRTGRVIAAAEEMLH